MKEECVESIKLENGQTLEIFDRSRMIGADTWLVSLSFRITINIDNSLNINYETADLNTIKETLGPVVVYEVNRDRNFINENNKEGVLKEVKESFLNMNLKYLSHADFAKKYVMKQLKNGY